MTTFTPLCQDGRQTESNSILKRSHIMTKWALSQGCKDSSVFANQSMWYTTLTNATVIKTVWHWHKDRNADQGNKIESPEINSRTYGCLIFDKGAKIYNKEKKISLTSGAGKTGQPPVKEWKLKHFLTPNTKKNSTWIKDLNVRPETIKPPRGEHRQNTLWHKSQQDPLWPTSQNIRNKSKNKWDLMKLKSFPQQRKL